MQRTDHGNAVYLHAFDRTHQRACGDNVALTASQIWGLGAQSIEPALRQWLKRKQARVYESSMHAGFVTGDNIYCGFRGRSCKIDGRDSHPLCCASFITALVLSIKLAQ